MKKYFFGYLAITTALFWETLFGAVIVRLDLMLVSYPLKWLAAQLWSRGQLPLWNSAGGAGMPLLAYPFDPLLPLFMLPLGVYQCGTIYIWIKYFFAGLSMHRYLRVTGLSHEAAFLGGSAFMLSGFSIGSWTILEWVSALMFLPLVMTVPHIRGTPRGRGISAAVILSFSFWSGAIEPTLFMVIFWTAECLVHPKEGRIAEVMIGLLGFIALSLFQFLPIFEMALLSDRRGGLDIVEALSYSVSPFQMIGLISPITFAPAGGGRSVDGLFPFANPLFFGTYVGVALLPFALLAKRAQRFFIFSVAGVLLAAGRFLPGAPEFLENYPSFAVVRYPVKFLYLVPPSLAILAAHGWSSLPERRPSQRMGAVLGTTLLFVAVFILGTLWPDPSLPDGISSLIWQNHLNELTKAGQHAIVALLAAVLLILGFDSGKNWIRPVMILVIVLDLLIAARGAISFEPPSLDQPPKLRQALSENWPRILTVAEMHDRDPKKMPVWVSHDVMQPNAGIPYLVRHVHEYGSFRSKNFNRWFGTHVFNGDIRNLAAAGIAWFVCDETDAMSAVGFGWRIVAHDADLFLLENPLRMNEIRFYAGDTMPQHAFLRSPGVAVDFAHDLSGTARAFVPGIDRTSGWLYRAEHFYPGWKAYANGREIPVHESKDFFGQMVYLDPSTEPVIVEFRFEPPLFYIGLLAASCSAMLIALALMAQRISILR